MSTPDQSAPVAAPPERSSAHPEPSSAPPERAAAPPEGSAATPPEGSAAAPPQDSPATASTPPAEPPPVAPGPPSPPPAPRPRPSVPAGRAVPVAMAVVGLSAAVAVPLDRPGIGWLLTGAVGATATVVVARRLGGRSGPSRLAAAGWGAATLALFAVGTVRAAGWLFALCALAACLTGSLAVAGGGRSVRGLAAGAVALPLAALRGLPWVARALRRTRTAGAPRLSAALVRTTGVLVVFGALLASADAALSSALSRLVPPLRVDTALRSVFLFTAGALATGGAVYLAATPRGPETPSAPSRTLHRLEWGLPLAALVALFAGFVAVQVTVLFGGHRHVLATAGLTYAEYARGGFWQLLAVTALTLVVMAAAARRADRRDRADRWLLRGLLGGLAVLTLVIVASALYRMSVYEQAYGFTRLRLLVTAVELWLGLLFVLVLLALVRLRAAWLPRAVLGTGVATLLALAALNPDHVVAARNVERYVETGRIDVEYLAGLSADAVPALDRLPDRLRGCALRRVHAALLLGDRDSWNAWNLSRHRARALLEETPYPVCPAPAGRLAGTG